MGDRIDKYVTEWSKKRDAWLRSGRRDDSYLLRGDDLQGFREFVINEPHRVTSDDRGFLLACDRRADNSAIMRSQDVNALLLEDTDVTLISDQPSAPSMRTPIAKIIPQNPPSTPPIIMPPPPSPTAITAPQRPLPPPSSVASSSVASSSAASSAKPRALPGARWAIVLFGLNIVLFAGMMALIWLVKDRVIQLLETRSELEKTKTTLVKKTEELEKAHDDFTEKSKAKADLEKDLLALKTRRDEAAKSADEVAQKRRVSELQLEAVESALAVAQEEFGKQKNGKLKGKLKLEFDRLLFRRLLLMMMPRCAKDLADCSDEAIDQSARRLLPKGGLRDLVAQLPHVVIYPRNTPKNPKLLPLRETQLRKLLKLPGDKNDLLVIVSPRLPDEKKAIGETRYEALSAFLQKTLKLPPARLLRVNHASLLPNGALKGLTSAEKPKPGEVTPAEAIWVVRAPGPPPIT